MTAANSSLPALHARRLDSIDEIDAADWNRLGGTDQPFVRHEFLAALEHCGAAGAGSGWIPAHLVLRDQSNQLCGAMPLYLKDNSWGEFVFDFAWADAYRRAGLHYYPKLVSGVPYTPASGPRCLIAPQQDTETLIRQLLQAARESAAELGASSLHILFPAPAEASALGAAGLLLRKDCQFHWHNRNFYDFDHFLESFTASKRKKVKRERRRISEAGIRFRIRPGESIAPDEWSTLMPLYASTFWRRGREPYLPEAFFREISETMPGRLIVIQAEHAGEPIAVALCFRSADTLYGRYWGSAGQYHSLHFETCYYQGIEYCIDQGLARFEPGTQGEHKISRGFVPTETWSAHWLSHPQFAVAINDYLGRERDYIDEYIDAARQHVPYRSDSA